jgi:hypothetical protein
MFLECFLDHSKEFVQFQGLVTVFWHRKFDGLGGQKPVYWPYLPGMTFANQSVPIN